MVLNDLLKHKFIIIKSQNFNIISKSQNIWLKTLNKPTWKFQYFKCTLFNNFKFNNRIKIKWFTLFSVNKKIYYRILNISNIFYIAKMFKFYVKKKFKNIKFKQNSLKSYKTFKYKKWYFLKNYSYLKIFFLKNNTLKYVNKFIKIIPLHIYKWKKIKKQIKLKFFRSWILLIKNKKNIIYKSDILNNFSYKFKKRLKLLINTWVIFKRKTAIFSFNLNLFLNKINIQSINFIKLNQNLKQSFKMETILNYFNLNTYYNKNYKIKSRLKMNKWSILPLTNSRVNFRLINKFMLHGKRLKVIKWFLKIFKNLKIFKYSFTPTFYIYIKLLKLKLNLELRPCRIGRQIIKVPVRVRQNRGLIKLLNLIKFNNLNMKKFNIYFSLLNFFFETSFQIINTDQIFISYLIDVFNSFIYKHRGFQYR